ncbi:MAG: GntR family transcriptional regulator [Hungatella sp.]|nr:GntR family transcriptional regulator [Hungatella sp.]
MILSIDFNSDEAFYIQLRNQIIIGIATGRIREGDSLPSVRQLADNISINMHTVNKAYSVLKQEGFVKLDRRKGAVIALEVDKQQVLEEMKEEIAVVMAKGICKGIKREEVHQLVDEMYELFANWDETV